MRIRPAFCMILGTLLVAVSAACTSEKSPAAVPPTAPIGLPTTSRAESYGGLELLVPAGWGWGNGTQRLLQWCVGRTGKEPEPIVGRPGDVTFRLCPDGHTLLANTGPVVGFNRTKQADGVTHEGDRTTVRLDSVEVVVQAPAELRQRIVTSIRPVQVDSNGCPATHVISTKPEWRPGRAATLTSLEKVSTVSICKYQLGEHVAGVPGRLISSSRLDGAEAARAVGAVAKAPVGPGPDRSTGCVEGVALGNEAIIARIRSAAGLSDLVVRYSGCDVNGFDDGVVVRKLTAPALAPFIAGPHGVGVPLGSAW
jgi:hypothetical protein